MAPWRGEREPTALLIVENDACYAVAAIFSSEAYGEREYLYLISTAPPVRQLRQHAPAVGVEGRGQEQAARCAPPRRNY